MGLIALLLDLLCTGFIVMSAWLSTPIMLMPI